MKLVYETLRNSDLWNDTVLIITYDEHGGFYDHASTPMEGVPSPDGRSEKIDNFNFTRLGIRIPTLVISPWVNQGVIHGSGTPTPASQFEHSSIASTLKKMLNLPDFLTKRDEWASSFEDLFTERTSPRTDCPKTLPVPPVILKKPRRERGNRQMSELQRTLLYMIGKINGLPDDAIPVQILERDAAVFVRNQIKQYLGRRKKAEPR